MKIATLLILLLLIVSCREEEGVWDELTNDERAALRARAEQKCLADSNDHFDEFKTSSNANFYGSGAYVPGITFNYTLKQDSSTYYNYKITVWKVTPTDVYLLVVIDRPTAEHRFLKIPKATNNSMITDLQGKYCDKTTSRDQDFSLSTSSRTYQQITKINSTLRTTYTFTYSASLLAFLSSYKESRSDQPLDANGSNTGTITKWSGALTGGALETNIPEYNTYAQYLSNYPSTTLCLVNSSKIPYSMTCDATGATTFLSSEL